MINVIKGDIMTKWNAVIIGFILAVIVKSFFAQHEFIGLLIVGFITGYIAHDGALGGMWNAAVAGALDFRRKPIRHFRRTNRIYHIRSGKHIHSSRLLDLLCNRYGNNRSSRGSNSF